MSFRAYSHATPISPRSADRAIAFLRKRGIPVDSYATSRHCVSRRVTSFDFAACARHTWAASAENRLESSGRAIRAASSRSPASASESANTAASESDAGLFTRAFRSVSMDCRVSPRARSRLTIESHWPDPAAPFRSERSACAALRVSPEAMSSSARASARYHASDEDSPARDTTKSAAETAITRKTTTRLRASGDRRNAKPPSFFKAPVTPRFSFLCCPKPR